jgi:hypothetical protein
MRETEEREEGTNRLADLLEAAEALGLGGEVLVGFREGVLASLTLTSEGIEVNGHGPRSIAMTAGDVAAWDWQVLTKTTRH